MSNYSSIIRYNRLTIREAKAEYPTLWNTFLNEFPRLTEDDFAVMVAIAVDKCPYCHSATRSCKCWNDE